MGIREVQLRVAMEGAAPPQPHRQPANSDLVPINLGFGMQNFRREAPKISVPMAP